MMVAAIYARRSHEQNGVADNVKSVTRQSSTREPMQPARAGRWTRRRSTWTTA
jgi:hypothetical protein